jgi:hypothetical protein
LFILSLDQRRGLGPKGSLTFPQGKISHNVGYYLYLSLYPYLDCDPGFMSIWGSNKASKTIGPPGKPEGNTVHRVHCAVSPEIVLMGGCNTHVFAA